jgi:hypothetical protein
MQFKSPTHFRGSFCFSQLPADSSVVQLNILSQKDKLKSLLSSTIESLPIGLLGAVAYFVLGINLLSFRSQQHI